MIVFGVLLQDEAFYSHEHGVDHDVIFLLIGLVRRRSQRLNEWFYGG